MGLKYQILKNLPFSVYKNVDKRPLIGAYYHLVKNESCPYISPIFSYKNHQQFEQDLQEIKKYYRPITYSEYLEGTPSTKTKKNIILSFDDGYRELLTEVLPLLKKHSIPALFFITTSLIDNKAIMFRNLIALIITKIESSENHAFSKHQAKLEEVNQRTFSHLNEYIAFLKSVYTDKDLITANAKILQIDTKQFLDQEKPYLTTEELKTLYHHPLIQLGAHSVNHYNLGRLENKELVISEIVDSAQTLKSLTGQEYVPFAFPFTSEGVDHSILEQISQNHQWIKGFFGGFNYDLQDKIIIKRYGLDHPQLSFKQKVKHEAIHELYKRYF